MNEERIEEEESFLGLDMSDEPENLAEPEVIEPEKTEAPVESQQTTEQAPSTVEEPTVTQTPSLNDNSYNIPVDYLNQLSNTQINKEDAHKYLSQNDESYQKLVELYSNHTALDAFLSKENENYASLDNSLDKEQFRNAVMEEIGTQILAKVDTASQELGQQQKEQLINNIYLNNFENILTSNPEYKPLTDMGDNLYNTVLSKYNVEATPENKTSFSRSLNAALLNIGKSCGLNEKEFVEALSRSFNNLPNVEGLTKFNEQAVNKNQAIQRAKSITSQTVSTDSSQDEDDEGFDLLKLN